MESRSWTHLASNVTYLDGVRLGEHLDDLLRQGGAPVELMQQCLHEFTHHWCFFSSVGLSITGLSSRMARAALATVDDDDDYEWGVARDLVAYRTVTAALRPLTEGLALFAEFDARSLKSTVVSTPLRSTTLLFSGRFPKVHRQTETGDFVATDTGDDVLALSLPTVAALQRVRLTDEGIRRKRHVLAMSMRSDAEGYLTGYLAIKGMWRVLRQRSTRLYQETDLAMAYLNAFFYEDRRLIEILLAAGDEDENELTTAILRRVADRMGELAEVADDDVNAFERLVAEGTPAESTKYAACLHVGLDEWARGQRILEELERHLLAEPDEPPAALTRDEELTRDLQEVFALMVARRHIVHLGTHPAHVDVDGNGAYTVTLDDREILQGEAAELDAQSGDGSVELLFSSLSNRASRAVAIYGPKSFVDVVIPGSPAPDEEELNLVRRGIRPSALPHGLAEGALRLAEEFVREHALDLIVDYLTPHVESNVKRLYLNLATNAVADEHLVGISAKLDDGGVYALLDRDFDLLEALVIIGAAAPTMPLRTMLFPELESRGFTDADAVIEALVRVKERTGMPLVGSDGVEVFVQV